VEVTVVRGEGRADVQTTRPFLDHMLTALARTSGLDLTVRATGDLPHHLIEDVGITLGEALRPLAEGAIARYADRRVVMDDACVEVTLDAGGRAYYAGRLPAALYGHFLRSLADAARMTLHVEVRRGRDRHHIIEAAFKAFGLALADALAPASRLASTKGGVTLTREEGPC
jgi:imidazoleglycerol-phosphate dehydratase